MWKARVRLEIANIDTFQTTLRKAVDDRFHLDGPRPAAVDTARILAADAVEKVGNGHPGTAISLAPAAYLLYQKVMKGDPADPKWLGRDRFVLVGGTLLPDAVLPVVPGRLRIGGHRSRVLADRGLPDPGASGVRAHPRGRVPRRVRWGPGWRTPWASRWLPDASGRCWTRARRWDQPSVFDRTVFCIAGDGCMQEGVASEASILAGAQKLGNLVLIYDDNRISIEGGDPDRVHRGCRGPVRSVRLARAARGLDQRRYRLHRERAGARRRDRGGEGASPTAHPSSSSPPSSDGRCRRRPAITACTAPSSVVRRSPRSRRSWASTPPPPSPWSPRCWPTPVSRPSHGPLPPRPSGSPSSTPGGPTTLIRLRCYDRLAAGELPDLSVVLAGLPGREDVNPGRLG